ncbi:type 12 methyltransferase [Actinoplanes sp. SE50]|uniref:class I SAM-dependent methyltransferase n=1 Tax=unclassified Actinoplanes TaxID=2626549 RepID=UPI00023EDD17|nr:MULTISPECIES: class I SAM-dependent methyltransferase [unclassified Actinoplanes]AEV89130.1 methyltransferase type 12 [Actinoplanes sp. SE50/110]ATO87536.1 type 12 methyltransferase [Actinoplanes sp. SE50]SLM04954.1 type 12 methyltransferase [Actinoplanes sp. SE50/110]
MADITGDQRIQSEVLEGLATAVNHRRWFVELALPYLGDNPIEIGSGLGDYALEWAEHLPRFTATEADPDRLVQLKERMAGHANIEVRQMLLPAQDAAGEYSAAVSYNVLEHIEDHVGALRSMRELVRPGGHVIIIVPAFMFAMSQVDIATGHIRRYTKKTLGAAYTEAGLEIEKIHYANALGLIGYYGATSIFKLAPKEGPMVKVYDSLVLPVTKAAERIVRPPFGQSVFCVGRVPR